MSSIINNIIQDFIPVGRRNRPVTWTGGSFFNRFMIPEFITIHETGNKAVGANALSHAKYLKGDTAANTPVSWHFTVDDTRIVQHLPLNENGWHSGDGVGGNGNTKSIGIEICVNSDGNRTKADLNAVLLVAHLVNTVKSLRPYPECVKQHFHWSGKNCPEVIRSRTNGWNNFLAEIKKQIDIMTLPLMKRVFHGNVQVGAYRTNDAIVNTVTNLINSGKYPIRIEEIK